MEYEIKFEEGTEFIAQGHLAIIEVRVPTLKSDNYRRSYGYVGKDGVIRPMCEPTQEEKCNSLHSLSAV